MEKLSNETLDNAIKVYRTCIENAVEYDDDCEYNPILDKATVNFLEELKEYRDLEEQGLLLKLPCKVRDEIYLVDFEEKTYDVATVMSIEIDTRDNRILLNSDYEVGTWSEDSYVFYSKIEAEKALAEMGE